MPNVARWRETTKQRAVQRGLDLEKDLRRSAPRAEGERRILFNQTAGDVLRPSQEAQLAGIGGIFGERRLSPPRCTHDCALSQKISLAGSTQLASSRVPAITIVIFGMISASSMIADPHAGQKRR